jgi:hypothetical protein
LKCFREVGPLVGDMWCVSAHDAKHVGCNLIDSDPRNIDKRRRSVGVKEICVAKCRKMSECLDRALGGSSPSWHV